MPVVVANDLPPAVRGRAKLWFIEPRANVFVSEYVTAWLKVVNYLYKHCPPKSGLMIFNSSNTTPGYEIFGMGDTRKEITKSPVYP